MGEKVCELIVGGKTFRQIETLDGMPDRSTIIRWLTKHDEFRKQYARAREAQALVNEDEIAEIADDGTNDWMEHEKNGRIEIVLNEEHVRRSDLRVQTRKWLMSRRMPKRYGDALKHSNDPDNPMPGTGVIIVPAKVKSPQ